MTDKKKLLNKFLFWAISSTLLDLLLLENAQGYMPSRKLNELGRSVIS